MHAGGARELLQIHSGEIWQGWGGGLTPDTNPFVKGLQLKPVCPIHRVTPLSSPPPPPPSPAPKVSPNIKLGIIFGFPFR